MLTRTHPSRTGRRLSGILILTTGFATVALARDLPAPGHYEVTTTTHFSDGLMPDTTVTTQNCMTREDLEKDPASVFAELPDGKSCNVAEFLMEGGEIRMQINCAAPDGDMTMTVNGSYLSETYEMVSDVVVSVGDQAVTMQSTIAGKRVGDC